MANGINPLEEKTVIVISYLLQENLDSALSEFDTFLDEIQKLGKFDPKVWTLRLRSLIYDLGNFFKKYDANKFFEKINEKKSLKDAVIEPLDFIFSEIVWNFYEPNSEYVGNLFIDLIKKYPHNPEFHHSYSNYLELSGQLDKAVKQNRLALKIERENHVFLGSCFNKEKEQLDLLIKENKLMEAQKKLDEMRKFHLYRENMNLSIAMTIQNDRIMDHRIFAEKFKASQNKLDSKIKNVKIEHIGILSVFTAVIALIIFNGQIALKVEPIQNALFFMLAMAFVLLIFNISISYFLFAEKRKFWKETKFYILIVLIIGLVGLPFFYNLLES